MKDYLYHFFPRKFECAEEVITVVRSIMENGLYLSRETLKVNWEDRYAIRGRQRDLTAEQMRLCLTAITNEAELVIHSRRFGFIALAFDLHLIVKMGGFPIFYVPTPKNELAGMEEYTGISLLYRLADAQQVFDYIIKNNILLTDDIDLKNVLGAIKFLANICYPTQRKPNLAAGEVTYYNQREWRIIHHLTSAGVRIGLHANTPTIEAYNDVPIRECISSIILFKYEGMSEKTCHIVFNGVQALIAEFGLTCPLIVNDTKLN